MLRRIARKRHPLHGGAVLDGQVTVVDPSYQAVAAEVLDRFIEKGWQQKPANYRVAVSPAIAEKAGSSPSLSEKPHASAVCSGPASQPARVPLNLGSSTAPAGSARGHDAEARIQPISGRTPAQERMEALRQRVLSRARQ